MTQAFNLSQLANGANTSGQLNASNYLYNQVPVANGGTALSSAGATGNMLIASSASAYSTVKMPTFSYRNRIINGDMRVDQRSAGASVTPAGGGSAYYSCDRWQQFLSQSSKYSIQQSTTSPAGFTNSLLATSLSAYSVLAADNFSLSQQIEGFNVADLGWGASGALTVTLSFWVRSSLTGTFGGALANSAVNRSYPFTFTISTANTFEYKTITVAGDTTGTWLTNNGTGLRVWFSLGSGSTYTGTAGAWAAADYRSATGATSVVGTNGATFYVTGVQLEVGTVATPFERQLYNAQLAQCQRYYEHSYSQDTAVGTSTDTGTVSTRSPQADMQDTIQFAVEKRATPTITFYTNLGVSGSWRSMTAATNRLMAAINSGTRQFTWSNSNSVTVGDVLRGHWTASIEL